MPHHGRGRLPVVHGGNVDAGCHILREGDRRIKYVVAASMQPPDRFSQGLGGPTRDLVAGILSTVVVGTRKRLGWLRFRKDERMTVFLANSPDAEAGVFRRTGPPRTAKEGVSHYTPLPQATVGTPARAARCLYLLSTGQSVTGRSMAPTRSPYHGAYVRSMFESCQLPVGKELGSWPAALESAGINQG